MMLTLFTTCSILRQRTMLNVTCTTRARFTTAPLPVLSQIIGCSIFIIIFRIFDFPVNDSD